MNNDRTVSVIIPVYNAADTIEEAVNSILAQKGISGYTCEIVLVNDGSKDTSAAVCAGLAAEHPAVKAFDKPNGGVSSARNYGLLRASGDYILFVDADDRLAEHAIAQLINAGEQYGADLVCGGYEILEDGVIRDGFLPREQTADGADQITGAFARMETENSTLAGSPWGKLFRKQIIEDYQLAFPEETSFGEDYLFCADYYTHCRRVRFLHAPVYVYAVHAGSLVTSFREDSPDMYTMLCRRKLTFYRGNDKALSFVKTMYVEQMIASYEKAKRLPVQDLKAYIRRLMQTEPYSTILKEGAFEKRSPYIRLMAGLSRRKLAGITSVLVACKCRIKG
jgi:glycosyltransferase involved in cell wall biosynthesis